MGKLFANFEPYDVQATRKEAREEGRIEGRIEGLVNAVSGWRERWRRLCSSWLHCMA